MLNSFQTIIFREVDETDEGRGVWVRIEPSNWGFTVATFKDEPTTETPEWQAMSVTYIDPCFRDQTKIVAWDETQDSEYHDGTTVILVKSVDGYKPREEEQAHKDC